MAEGVSLKEFIVVQLDAFDKRLDESAHDRENLACASTMDGSSRPLARSLGIEPLLRNDADSPVRPRKRLLQGGDAGSE